MFSDDFIKENDEEGIRQTFLFRNINFSSVLGLRRVLFFDTTSPAFENTLSQGTDEAGVHKYLTASLYR